MSKILISILLSLGLCSGGAGVRYFNSNNISILVILIRKNKG